MQKVLETNIKPMTSFIRKRELRLFLEKTYENCKMTTRELGREKKRLHGRTKETQHVFALFRWWQHSSASATTDWPASGCKERIKEEKNTQRTSGCSGGGFARALHPHSLLQNIQRRSFLKGKVNRKKEKTVAVLSDSGKHTRPHKHDGAAAAADTRTDEHFELSHTAPEVWASVQSGLAGTPQQRRKRTTANSQSQPGLLGDVNAGGWTSESSIRDATFQVWPVLA